jgi:tryptophan-rich sensory protein
MFIKKNFVLMIMILMCLLVELSAKWFTDHSVHTWYPSLIKPMWTAPGYIFGPVWTLLYILMGISIWHAWKTPSHQSKTAAYTFFAVQLTLNFLWSALFFGLQNPFWGLIDIVLLWIFIMCTILKFYQIKPLAAYLLIPYLMWVSYAMALNYAIWKLNY